MNREDRKLWTRIVKNAEDKKKLDSYKQDIRDGIQELEVCLGQVSSET